MMKSAHRFTFRAAFLLVLGLLWLVRPAQAAITVTFYSHEFGQHFPHAFVKLEGTDDRTGARVDTDYGFTAASITPAILMGPVKGEIVTVDNKKYPGYIERSDKHFSFTLSDDQYRALLATVEKWRNLKQPSYSLNRQNCVYFVADVAASIGMRANTPKGLMKKPRSYTEYLTRENRDWLAAREAVLYRQVKAAAGR